MDVHVIIRAPPLPVSLCHSLICSLTYSPSPTPSLCPSLSPILFPLCGSYTCTHTHSLTHSLTRTHTQDSEIFCSIDSSEYIADLWRNPNHLTKENLQKFEGVSHSLEASLTLGAHAQRGLQYLVCHSVRPSVCLSVCLSVTTFSGTMCNKAAKKRYQWVQYHTGLI